MSLIFSLVFLFSLSTFSASNCDLGKGSLPFPNLKIGTNNKDIPIEHIIVIIQENRSFDHYFGNLNKPEFYGQEVDGLTPAMGNFDSKGNWVSPYHEERYCTVNADHSWRGSHSSWNNGAMDKFVVTNEPNNKGSGTHAMSYYNEQDIPYYYWLANTFAISDRFFTSMLGPTGSNRLILYSGTSAGRVKNPKAKEDVKLESIFHVMDRAGIDWKYYYSDMPYLGMYKKFFFKTDRAVAISEYDQDMLRGAKFPQVAFVEQSALFESEEPPRNLQMGQAAVARRLKMLFQNEELWKRTVVFFTYDEGGGYFDHVAPPEVCAPDDIQPVDPEPTNDRFTRLGFRVPFIAVSPYVKRHYVSHENADHTSILKFIQLKFNLPALGRRDANAQAMLDLFDFKNPNFEIPKVPKAKVNLTKLRQCLKKP